MTPLSQALIGEFIDAVLSDQPKAATMLTAHPDLLNARWIHDETALHFLAVEGFAEGVRFLAERGADVNAVNEFGDSALIDVATIGRANDVAEILLAHGANPNATSITRDNVLHGAVRSGNARLVACCCKPAPIRATSQT
jgi:ankyrin repeat protein